jgi:hypothetical protein
MCRDVFTEINTKEAAMVTQSDTVNIPSKDQLLEDFIQSASETFHALQYEFGFKELVSHFLDGRSSQDLQNEELKQQIKKHVKATDAWTHLNRLYDFAVDGLSDGEEISYIVTNAADILDLVGHSKYPLHPAWKRLVWQGDGRVNLEEGGSFELDKLAYLADVDVRTVRNAISAGALTLTKVMGTDMVESESARKWLLGRRGFKPTVHAKRSSLEMEAIDKPYTFGILLTQQRDHIVDEGGVLNSQHAALTPDVISDLESGLFNLPLSMTNPVADYYQLARKPFLACVMRSFFAEQYQMMREIMETQM